MTYETHSADERAIAQLGYKQELSRGLGYISSFSISFSYMSVLTGVYANFGFVLSRAGPFGLWTWILVACGHILTALLFAEMVASVPLAGSSYNWNSRLSNPQVGWFAGWMALFAYIIGVSAVTATVVQPLATLFGFTISTDETKALEVMLIVGQAVINVYGVRFAARLNVLAVLAEIAALLGFGGFVFYIGWAHHGLHFDLLTRTPEAPRPYVPAFLSACLLAAWTLLGFEGAADVSEETIGAKRVAPRGIIHSVIVCSVVGFAFASVLGLSISNLAQARHASDPVALILSGVVGPVLTNLFLVLVLISVFACSMVNMTGAARLSYAMSRDGRLPGSAFLRKVSGRKVPAFSTWVVALFASVFVLIADRITSLYGSGSVLFAAFYATTVIGYLASGRRIKSGKGFTLGRLGVPIAIAAISWHVIEIGILTVPKEFHPVAITAASVIAMGALVYVVGRFWHTPQIARLYSESE